MKNKEKVRAERDRLRLVNAGLIAALKKIIRYEQETEWLTSDGLAPLAVTECANMARCALASAKETQ